MRRAAATPLFVAVVIGVLVGGCTTPGPAVTPQMSPISADAPFAIDGRLSARHGRDGVAIAFSWTHAPPRDELAVSTPLGQSIAELSGDASVGRVELRTADGRREVASDWGALTERAVGVALPVEGLAAWAQGAPRPNAAHSIEPDAAGRAGVLRQDGCEIVYAYPDDLTRRPSGIRIACHDLEMRIAIERWRDS